MLGLLSSCVSNKKYVYLQDKGTVKTDSSGIMPVTPYAYKLQIGDILYISLTSDDEKLSKVFIPGGGENNMMMQGQQSSGSPLYFIGFTIDPNGEIEFPILGKISVVNKNIDEAKVAIHSILKLYLKEFYLQVKVAEFKFSILGSVNKPGIYFFNQNKVNILEALSQAGDLQSLAKRVEIQLYRQYPTGIKMHKINLTDRSIINSSYWYIQPNDVLYAVPLKARSIGDLSTLQSSFATVAPLLSTLLLVVNTYFLLQRI